MFFMYVDESGDVGMGPGSSNYFVLSSLIIHEAHWYETMQSIADMRDKLYRAYGYERNKELHAKNLIGRSTDGRQGLTRLSAILMLRDVIKFEAGLEYVRLINVVVDKRGKGFGFDAFSIAWNTLINRFENTISHRNFPSPWNFDIPNEKGFIIVDQTDERKLRALVRRMRWNNKVPSIIYPGETYLANLTRVVEDPMHKQSEHSLPIQLCDVNGYFLKQSIEPNSTVKKHKAKNYFYFLEPILLKEACKSNPYGIVMR